MKNCWITNKIYSHLMVGTNVMVLMHAAKPHFGITFSSTPKQILVVKSWNSNSLTSYKCKCHNCFLYLFPALTAPKVTCTWHVLWLTLIIYSSTVYFWLCNLLQYILLDHYCFIFKTVPAWIHHQWSCCLYIRMTIWILS